MPEVCPSVLMTTDAVGGVWTFSIGLANEFTRRGLRVTLVVLGPPPTEHQRSEALTIQSLTLHECNEDLEWMDDPWIGVERSGQYLLALAKEYSPQIVHLSGYAHATLTFDCPKLVTAHSCVLSWWEAVKGEPAPARYSEYRRVVRRGLSQADQIVAPSRALLAALRRIYGISAGVVIPNGIAPVHRGLPAKAPFVLCTGRVWDEAKNLRAVAVAAQSLNIPVYVAGPGSERLDGVIPLGTLCSGRLRPWLERAAIYAAPAYYEPFGLGILEAATYGAALVLGDIKSLREIWGDAAIFVGPDDTAGLRNAIELLARDRDLREAMAERAFRRAAIYSVERQASLYLETYQEVLQRHHGISRSVLARKLPTVPVEREGGEPCGL